MVKKTLQDVTPPKRSIQDIPVPNGKNRQTKKKSNSGKKPIGFLSSARGKKKNGKLKKKFFGFVVLLAVIITLFFLLMSSEVVITVTPVQMQERVDSNFIAVSDNETGGIPFDIVMIDEIGSEEIQSAGEEEVKEKASGQILIFNNFDTNSQRLIKNTRFETPEGLIYRIQNSVVVPGQTAGSDGEMVPGSVEVTVYADQAGEEYNIGLTDFTIPGFAGTDRFAGFYARSKTPMAGGFEGVKKIASEEDILTARNQIIEKLEKKLSQEILTKIPDNFILYENGLFLQNYFVGTEASEETRNDLVTVKEKVSAYAVIFDKNILSRQIASTVLEDYQGEELAVSNLDKLDFEIKNREETEPWVEGRFIFSLKGEANFEWLFDEEALKNDFVGQSKSETNNILANYSGIKEAEIEITPFWKNSFPRSTSQIEIIKKGENEQK